jgi:hypothetical protein
MDAPLLAASVDAPGVIGKDFTSPPAPVPISLHVCDWFFLLVMLLALAVLVTWAVWKLLIK